MQKLPRQKNALASFDAVDMNMSPMTMMMMMMTMMIDQE